MVEKCPYFPAASPQVFRHNVLRRSRRYYLPDWTMTRAVSSLPTPQPGGFPGVQTH